MIPEWIVILFVFVFGISIGSFLNVVIYRLPKDISLVRPASSCPGCGKLIKFYDNIPLLSWLLLRGKCRNCKSKISARYFIVELFTGLMFVGLYVLYFLTPMRNGLGGFFEAGWLIYVVHILMIAGLIAASAIDLELWIIPLSICWFITIIGFLGSAAGPFVYGAAEVKSYFLFPVASAKVAIMAAGGFVGWVISFVCLITGVFKTSYLGDDSHPADEPNPDEPDKFNHRIEMLKEVIFLGPIVVCAIVAFKVYQGHDGFANWWVNLMQTPVLSGVMGSLWGYFIGCAVVWGTRIFGTFLFGKEAMGLGDVHLMGAAGAVLGPELVVFAFFVAPFFGLLWAFSQMFFKKMRQIPYGPFLSIGLFVVMILHDGIRNWLSNVIFR